MLDLKIKVGHFDLYFMVMRLMSQYDFMSDFKIKVGHCDLYFLVH